MKVTRTPGRGLGQRIFFEEEDFDRIALEALQKSGALPAEPAPIRIDRFVEKHFQLNLEYSDLGEGVLGATMFRKNGAVCGMAVAPGLGEERMVNLFRSTVAHEAGHGLLHPMLFMQDEGQSDFRIDNADLRGGRILCRSQDIRADQPRGYSGRWWEYQANRMIGSLLLPRKLVIVLLGKLLTKTAVTGSPVLPQKNISDAIRLVSNELVVSKKAAEIRLQEIFPAPAGQQEF